MGQKNFIYKRVLIKISGESFGSHSPFDNIDNAKNIIQEIATLSKQKTQLGLIIGGGNIVRGATFQKYGIPRDTGDNMGMLATTINALLLSNLLQKEGCKSHIITSRMMDGIGETYQYQKVINYLEDGYIVLFSGGTGHPYFTTDTTAALRAVEIGAECFFKATKVDGIYDKDPVINPDAKKFDFLTFQDALSGGYKVMDLTAVAFCLENELPIRVFNLAKSGNLLAVAKGKDIGTLISNEKVS